VDSAAVKCSPAALLAWYDHHARVLPWRVPPGQGRRPIPYHVWLSEIMLQQTTVATVGPYFRDFLARWPTVRKLASAPVEQVLAAWAGLGYYARARNLHRCAQVVVECHGGRFPSEQSALLELPGIGPYTAAAIAAIAFDGPAVPVDGNVERVVARLFAIRTPMPDSKPALREAAARLLPAERTGDFAQALMDLGATVCTPRDPKCMLCPWHGDCAAHAQGIAEQLPVRAAKPPRPLRHGVAFVLRSNAGDAIWVRRRPPKGLLGGMLELPSTPWQSLAPDDSLTTNCAPGPYAWRQLPGTVRHVFTHFELNLRVWVAAIGAKDKAEPPLGEGQWLERKVVPQAGLPTVMKKILAHAESAQYDIN
jgi:A/G-specific adenine glycosylase